MVNIQVTYRRTRRLSMRIVKNGDVHVSAPIGVSKAEVERFINEHREWISEARKKTSDHQAQRAAFFNRLPLQTRAQVAEARQRLQALVEPMVEHHARRIGVTPPPLRYRPMVSRWGVCNLRSHTITFSLFLLLLPDWCIEHVVVHELCHLREPSHNTRFHTLMDHYYPCWREARKETLRISRQ